ncbi:TRM11 family SAM-dependent methyltransferase [Ureibacillus terrenus]|uniref:TRM11 family SAM-dependent methyltransferase n=1 Tax=Ureibacillus terrenus TaxID=118246 RepID=UPI002E1BEA3B|nr:RsmD family RNA methyltransferase [Ureibacillus terrenus]
MSLIKQPKYIYTYIQHPDEFELSRMEMRSFFGFDTKENYIISDRRVDPSRSPFMEDRLEVYFEADSLEDLEQSLKTWQLNDATFKVVCLNKMDIGNTKKIHHPERRKIEKQIGLSINGEPDLNNPDILLGLLCINDRWYLGKTVKAESIWRKHLQKPNNFSTALSTRVARAIVNIAIPEPEGVRAIDPCCGIGTVLIEALSMNVNIVGRDISPLVCVAARENIAHFGYETTVTKGSIADVTEHFDVAIVDLPYNICTHVSLEEEFEIIRHARRIADRVLFVSVKPIEDLIHKAGFVMKDRSVAKKANFVRHILLCE